MPAPRPLSARAKQRREEDQIQRSILDYIERVVPHPHLCFHVPNGGLRSRAEASILKGLGVKAGVFDLVLLMPGGRAYQMEVKTQTGELEDSQEAIKALYLKMRQPHAVVRSIDDVRAALAHWQIETRESKT